MQYTIHAGGGGGGGGTEFQEGLNDPLPKPRLLANSAEEAAVDAWSGSIRGHLPAPRSSLTAAVLLALSDCAPAKPLPPIRSPRTFLWSACAATMTSGTVPML